MADETTSEFPAPAPPDLSPRAFAAALALLLVATVAAFSPVLRAGLLGWDDQQTIARNPLFLPPSFDAIAYYFRHSHMHLYVPATYAAWTALATIAYDGKTLSPLPFHAANLCVHLATILVVVAMLRRLGVGRGATLVGAAVVALHPVQVEAVAWASGFKDVASTLLILVAAVAWTGVRTAHAGRWMAIATAAYVVALFTKPTAIVTPFVALALGVARGEPWRIAARRLVPWIVLAVPVALIGRSVQPPSHGDVAPLHLRPLLALDSIGWYARTLAWPGALAVDHGRTPTRVLDGDVPIVGSILGVALVAAVCVVAYRARPIRRRRIAVGGAIALVALAPVLGLVPFDFQAISGVAEHYLYPAMPGVALVVATLLARVRPRGLVAIAAAFACVAGTLTFRQARTWHDDTTLFNQVLVANPESWTAASAFSVAALDAGNIDEAERWARLTIERNPRSPNGWANLAAAQSRRGDKDGAIASLEQAYAIEPDNAIVNLNLGGLLAERGDLSRAFPLLDAAARLDPTNAAAHGNLALAMLQLDRATDALRHLDVAVRLAPDDAEMLARRALVYNELARPGLARRDAEAAIALDANSKLARRVLADLDAATTRQTP